MTKLRPAYVYLAVGVALILGWFYWYEYRPSEATSECAKWAADTAKQQPDMPDGSYDLQVRDHLYDVCLQNKGL